MARERFLPLWDEGIKCSSNYTNIYVRDVYSEKFNAVLPGGGEENNIPRSSGMRCIRGHLCV